MNQPSVLQEFGALVGNLRQRQGALRQELEHIERDIGAIQRAMELYRDHHGITTASAVMPDLHTAPGESLGKRRRAALVMFAQARKGIVVASEAVPALVTAGLFESTKKARNQLYQILDRMEDMEKVTPGTYRLIEVAPELAAEVEHGQNQSAPEALPIGQSVQDIPMALLAR